MHYQVNTPAFRGLNELKSGQRASKGFLQQGLA